MRVFLIILIILAGFAVLLFVGCLAAMWFIFIAPPKLDREDPKPDPLMGEDLPAFIRACSAAAERVKAEYPHERVSVKTDDGLTLYGDFFLNENPTDKTILCSHGYNTSGFEDFPLMVEPILRRGYNCFLLNHRRFGGSEGKYTGFGILESRDMLKWIELINRYFPDGKIVLYGISMGAAAVMQASDLPLPENVVGIVEDCGFTSAYEEFRYMLKRMAHLPGFPLLNVLGWQCKRFLKLDIKANDSRKCVAATKLPMLFLHGGADAFVPAAMAKECCEACGGEKRLVIFEGAAHAQSHFKHPEQYEREFFAFVERVMIFSTPQRKKGRTGEE